MADDEGKKEEERSNFIPEGEEINHVTLDQACVLAIEYARGYLGSYRSNYADQGVVWEVSSQEERGDYYDIRLSYRPGGTFQSRPGAEQYTIDKIGQVRFRQRLKTPSRWDPRVLLPYLVWLLAIGGMVCAAFPLGASGNSRPPTEPTPIATAPRNGAANEQTKQLTQSDVQQLISSAIKDDADGTPSRPTGADITGHVDGVLAASQSAGDQRRTQAEADLLPQQGVTGTRATPVATPGATPIPSPIPTEPPTTTVVLVPPADSSPPTSTPEPTSTPFPTRIPRPTPKPTPTPIPRSTLAPTAAPVPTPTLTVAPTPSPTRITEEASIGTLRIAVSSRGVFLVEGGNSRVEVYSTGGNLLREWGAGAAGSGGVQHHGGVAINNQNLYVASTSSHEVQIFTTYGTYIDQWGTQGSEEGQFQNPRDVAIFGSRVYIADTGNHRVQVLSIGGTFFFEWGTKGDGDGEFDSPTAIAVSNDIVYVVDSGNHRVQIFTLSGTYIGQWGSEGTGEGQFKRLAKLDVSESRVFVVDSGNHRVQFFSLGGNFLGEWEIAGIGEGQFEGPSDIAVYNNRVYIVMKKIAE